MKQSLINYYNNKLRSLRRQKNAMSEQDALAAEEAIEELTTLINDLKADEEEHTAEEALKTMQAAIDEKIKALAEKIEKEPETEPEPAESYLKSKNAVHDWCNALRSRHANEFRAKWSASLRTNGISFVDGTEGAYLPEAVKGEIVDAYEKPGNWLNLLNNTGAKRFNIRYNASTQTSETSRAKGHTAGGTKTPESLTFSRKEVNAQYIYKIIDIDNLTEWADDEALMRYVAKELLNQWLWEVQKAVLVGDGREASDAKKITSVESVYRTSTDSFVTVNTHDASNELKDELVQMVADIKNDGEDIIMFMSRNDLNTLRRHVAGANATPVYQPVQSVADELGVAQIIATDILGSGVKALAFTPSKYVTVGSLNPEMVEWEDYLTNVTYTRLEIPFGGAVEGLKSASVLKAS